MRSNSHSIDGSLPHTSTHTVNPHHLADIEAGRVISHEAMLDKMELKIEKKHARKKQLEWSLQADQGMDNIHAEISADNSGAADTC